MPESEYEPHIMGISSKTSNVEPLKGEGSLGRSQTFLVARLSNFAVQFKQPPATMIPSKRMDETVIELRLKSFFLPIYVLS